MLNMCRGMDREISSRIKSMWNVFTTIRDVLNANLDRALCANLFNNTIFPSMFYTSESGVPQWKTDYDSEDNKKAHAGNINPKRGN